MAGKLSIRCNASSAARSAFLQLNYAQSHNSEFVTYCSRDKYQERSANVSSSRANTLFKNYCNWNLIWTDFSFLLYFNLLDLLVRCLILLTIRLYFTSAILLNEPFSGFTLGFRFRNALWWGMMLCYFISLFNFVSLKFKLNCDLYISDFQFSDFAPFGLRISRDF